MSSQAASSEGLLGTEEPQYRSSEEVSSALIEHSRCSAIYIVKQVPGKEIIEMKVTKGKKSKQKKSLKMKLLDLAVKSLHDKLNKR